MVFLWQTYVALSLRFTYTTWHYLHTVYKRCPFLSALYWLLVSENVNQTSLKIYAGGKKTSLPIPPPPPTPAPFTTATSNPPQQEQSWSRPSLLQRVFRPIDSCPSVLGGGVCGRLCGEQLGQPWAAHGEGSLGGQVSARERELRDGGGALTLWTAKLQPPFFDKGHFATSKFTARSFHGCPRTAPWNQHYMTNFLYYIYITFYLIIVSKGFKNNMI